MVKEIDRKTKPGWIIHYIANGTPCSCCGKISNPYLRYICDAHTHGMNKYGHLEFQVILDTGPKHVGYILNELGYRVRSGQTFKSGDFVDGIFEDCLVRLMETTDSAGEKILRVIIPDDQNHWPEDKRCHAPYTLQTLSLKLLENPSDHYHIKN